MPTIDPHDLRRERNPAFRSRLPTGYQVIYAPFEQVFLVPYRKADKRVLDSDAIAALMSEAYALLPFAHINLVGSLRLAFLVVKTSKLPKKAGFSFSAQEAIAGAVWAGVDEGIYHFDTVVSSKHRGKGLGSFLLDQGLRHFEDLRREDPTLDMLMTVINPYMRDALLHRGYRILWTERGFGTTWMMGE